MSAASVAAHLPFALSLLHTVATQYPGLQKAQPTTTTVAPNSSSGPVASTASSLLASALANLPNPSGPAPQAQQSSNPSTASTPPATSTSNLCENCHLKPKYNDGRKTHPYCSKSCAKAKAGGNPSNSNCDFCHSRPKYPGHPFCSKACAKKAAAGQTAPSGNLPSTCQAPGCQKAAHTNPDGTCGEYCSLSHKTLAETLCLLCLQNPKMANSHFCGKACSDDAEKKGPMILEVPVGHVTFKSVADQFKTSWGS
ncbi:hypothetical protein MPER_07524 [Moniliophthora perniciosa FA553]|nr:hypothetical protein MPER_07524 [Moniliophthora perniciosa FA553]